MAAITMKQLLESGVHFGHQTRRWNPKMDRYIYTSRNGIHIIDLQQTVGLVEEAYQRLLNLSKEGGKVLFVGTKKQAQDVIIEEAKRAGQYYVSKRWLGGTLTNFKTIRKSVRRLQQIKQMEKDGTFERLPKKEVIGLRKELIRLEAFLGGIEDMRTLPEAVFIVDPNKERNAILEARKLGIPVYSMVDSNCDPDDVDFAIPANDDAIRSIKVIVSTMANALIEGSGGVEHKAEPKSETSETVKPKETQRPQRHARPDQRGAQRQQRDGRPTERQSQAPVRKVRKPEEKPVVKETAKPVKKEVAPVVKKEEVAPVVKKEVAPVVKKEVAPVVKKEAAPVVKKETKPEPKVDYESMTVAELRELAKDREMTGYSKLRKAELIDALKE